MKAEILQISTKFRLKTIFLLFKITPRLSSPFSARRRRCYQTTHDGRQSDKSLIFN